MTASTQHPIGSGFTRESTAREVVAGIDLAGKLAIVTGGGAGVGLETARALAGAGATVVVGARRLDDARAVLAGTPRVEVAALDLMDPRSIDAFAAPFASRALHLLVNNAGIMAVPLARDAFGFESQLATNHVGHFQLTARLWPSLVRAAGARVVALTSRGHSFAAFDFEDPQFERRDYDKWKAYGQSKTANVLHAVELDRRGREVGVRAFAVHPGAVETELSKHVPRDELQRMRAARAADPSSFWKQPPQGAATSVWAATSPRLAGLGGLYLEDCDVSEAVAADATTLFGVRPWAIDPALADKLWGVSERWIADRGGH
jgi:NAD(P)-dependent dehydrogenase (short-subunit alcohol dehydrogenase family)|nr:SDR family NAD(P)-dependent oxidoreductase [Kofleriaceae bacterium]